MMNMTQSHFLLIVIQLSAVGLFWTIFAKGGLVRVFIVVATLVFIAFCAVLGTVVGTGATLMFNGDNSLIEITRDMKFEFLSEVLISHDLYGPHSQFASAILTFFAMPIVLPLDIFIVTFIYCVIYGTVSLAVVYFFAMYCCAIMIWSWFGTNR